MSIVSNCQFKKGLRLAGATIGSSSFSAGTTNYDYPTSAGYSADNTNFNLSLSPYYGVFITNKAAIGISLLLNSSYQKINNRSIADTIFSSSQIKNTDLGIGGFIRYYFTNSKNLQPFLHFFLNSGTGFGSSGGYSFGVDPVYGTYRDSYEGKPSGRFFLNSGINLGFTKMLGGCTGLEAYAGYVYSYTKNKTEINSVRDFYTGTGPNESAKFEPTQKFTGNGIAVGIGLQIFLER